MTIRKDRISMQRWYSDRMLQKWQLSRFNSKKNSCSCNRNNQLMEVRPVTWLSGSYPRESKRIASCKVSSSQQVSARCKALLLTDHITLIGSSSSSSNSSSREIVATSLLRLSEREDLPVFINFLPYVLQQTILGTTLSTIKKRVNL